MDIAVTEYALEFWAKKKRPGGGWGTWPLKGDTLPMSNVDARGFRSSERIGSRILNVDDGLWRHRCRSQALFRRSVLRLRSTLMTNASNGTPVVSIVGAFFLVSGKFIMLSKLMEQILNISDDSAISQVSAHA